MNDHANPVKAVDRPRVTDASALIEVVLQGGPATLPEGLRKCHVTTGQEKVKVAHYGGYEHFERDGGSVDGVIVFRWTGRTRVAE